MHFSSFLSLISLICAIGGAALPTEQVNDTSGCNGLEHCPVDTQSAFSRPSKTVTSAFGNKKAKLNNAQRLMCGLPLEIPRRRATGMCLFLGNSKQIA